MVQLDCRVAKIVADLPILAAGAYRKDTVVGRLVESAESRAGGSSQSR
jgi:hypothetical protein